MIVFPPLTEERRRDMVKIAGRILEEAKISIRNIRGEYKKKIDAAKADKSISEDIAKNYEADLQKHIDQGITEIERIVKTKEADIMKI